MTGTFVRSSRNAFVGKDSEVHHPMCDETFCLPSSLFPATTFHAPRDCRTGLKIFGDKRLLNQFMGVRNHTGSELGSVQGVASS